MWIGLEIFLSAQVRDPVNFQHRYVKLALKGIDSIIPIVLIIGGNQGTKTNNQGLGT